MSQDRAVSRASDRFNAWLAETASGRTAGPVGVAIPTWMRHQVLAKSNGACRYCGRLGHAKGSAKGGALTVDLLVPEALGGIASGPNLVAACRGCASDKRGMDWLAWRRGERPEELKTLRAAALEEGINHAVLLNAKRPTTTQVRRVLEQRWEHPRFAAFAAESDGVGIVGPAPGQRLPTDVNVVIRALGGLPNNQGAWWFPSERFQAAAEACVALNGWVRHASLGDSAVEANDADADLAQAWAMVAFGARAVRKIASA